MMSHRVHTQKDRTTNLLISSNVQYVRLGGDNKYQTSESLRLVNVLLESGIFCTRVSTEGQPEN